jgi:hypothetical protein
VSEHLALKPIRASLLRDFVRYWLECRAEGAVVTRRADFDIFHLRALIPHLFLYDYNPSDQGFTLRVAGEEIRRLLPNSVAGMPLDRIMPPAFFTEVHNRYRQVCERPAILHAIGRVFLNLGGSGVGERIALPLADEQGKVYQLLGATLYELGDQRHGSRFEREEFTLTFTPLTAE